MLELSQRKVDVKVVSGRLDFTARARGNVLRIVHGVYCKIGAANC